MGPKPALLLCFAACLQLSFAFMKISEFYDTDFPRCYDTNAQDPRRVSLSNIHGQALPLPNSIETFVSLIERYESLNPAERARDTATKLLQSFRIDDMDPDLQDKQLRETGADMHNDIKRAILNVPQPVRYRFDDDDFSDDEKCALHIMLSHTVNDTLVDGEAAEFDKNKAKQPIDVGVVSLNSRWDHAFALGRVLLGIAAAELPKEIRANDVLRALKKDSSKDVEDVALNPVFAVTLGDLATRLVPKNVNDDILILPNGVWDDMVCPTAYQLTDNNGGYVTLSELRGAIDGLIIGNKIQEELQNYNDLKLSQLLRAYYGVSGLLDNDRTTWCKRERALTAIQNLEGEMINFNKLFKVASGGIWSEKITEQMGRVVNGIKNRVKDIEPDPECSVSDMSPDRKYTTPSNIFVIMDYSAAKLQFQREVIGNLSTNFGVRPRGNLMGVYTNSKPTQQNMLDTIVKNSGIAGCPSCFAKYYNKQSSREDESEVFKDLNATFTAFEEENDKLEESYQEPKTGSPGKVVLYFNFGSSSASEYRLQEALWDIKRYFGGATILAVGDNKDTLKRFIENEDMDIFTGSMNAEKTAKDIKDRLKLVPAEFQYKDCYQSTPAKEAENKQEAYISYNKIQYWAMYPQYFLKSFGIRLKFKPQDGSTITVCFTRWFRDFIDRKTTSCQTSSGEEIEFHVSDPCKKRTVYNCDPFFFSVEGKKSPIETCKSLRCSTPNDIQFEFQHEGISCNMASLFSLSNMAILLAIVLFAWQRH